MTSFEIDIRDYLINGKSVQVAWDGVAGIVVSAVPGFESRKGLLCTVALGAKTIEEVSKLDHDRLVSIDDQ